MLLQIQTLFEKYFWTVTLWITVFFAPIQEFIFATGFFVFSDMITGIIASRRRGEALTSNKLFRSLSKFCVYGIAIIVAHVISLLYLREFPSVQLVAGLVAFIEIKSIDENIKYITGYGLLGSIWNRLKTKNDKNSR